VSPSQPEAKARGFAKTIRVTDERLVVELTDGREISVPLAWYPRLAHGTPEEWRRWELIGRGIGIHWPDLDEDISIESLLAGWRSSESEQSFQRWLDRRAAGLPADPTQDDVLF
jgi:hypothetical protein